jgi:Mrp family chromosome partitioning ATPase
MLKGRTTPTTEDQPSAGGQTPEAKPHAPAQESSLEGFVPVKRDDAVPNRPSLRVSPLLTTMPPNIVETFHYLVARLQLSETGLQSPVAIVGADHRVGVSMVTRALGAVLANDLDASVCIVDLSSPAPPGRSDDQSAIGLFDVVDQELPLSHALRTSADDRLMGLSAGVGSPAQARQLMRSPAMASVFEELSSMFEYVLLDVPPILASSSGVAMIRHARSYLMVVRHGQTTVDQVRAVSEQLKSLEPVGVVMNQVSSRIPKKLRRFFAM